MNLWSEKIYKFEVQFLCNIHIDDSMSLWYNIIEIVLLYNDMIYVEANIL